MKKQIAQSLFNSWLPAILWGVVIIYFSSQSRLPRPISSPGRGGEYLRKGLHFAEYAILAGLLQFALYNSYQKGRQLTTLGRVQRVRTLFATAGITLAFSILFASLDEWHQNFIPNRDASLEDVLWDITGAALALIAFAAVSLLGSREERTPDSSVESPLAISPPLEALKEPLFKRPFDVLLASFGLILSALLWPFIALGIKCEDGGPILLKEARWGRGGQAFDILKFRTTALSPNRRGAQLSITGDRYFTRVGRFLRVTGLDELPQLLNIWKGEMSFVGPRPLAVEEIPVHIKPQLLQAREFTGFRERLAVRPGLTGVAQIYGSKYISHRLKFRYDRLYIKHQSFLLDLELFTLSIWLSLRGKWETSSKKL